MIHLKQVYQGDNTEMESSELEQVLTENSIVAIAKDQVSADLAGEAVILNLKSGVYYGLNSVGAYIWSLIQEARNLGEIRGALLREYEVEPECLEHDLATLLKALVAAGLVEIRNETAV
jgi:hypothetical protein